MTLPWARMWLSSRPGCGDRRVTTLMPLVHYLPARGRAHQPAPDAYLFVCPCSAPAVCLSFNNGQRAVAVPSIVWLVLTWDLSTLSGSRQTGRPVCHRWCGATVLRCVHCLQRGLATRKLSLCPSLCPSVCQTRDLWQNERKFCPER